MLDEFAGIFALDQKIKNDIKVNDLNREVSALRRDQEEKEAIRKINDNFAQQQAQRTQDQLELAKESKAKLARENFRLEKILSSNPTVIADNAPELKVFINNERDVMTQWMASQKGFKDIANKFGAKLGISNEDVAKMAIARGIEILENEASQYNSRLEKSSEYDAYNQERVERARIALTEKYLK